MKQKIVTASLFISLVLSRVLIQPFYSLVSDCDETFNFWEPLNFLLRNFGKETWEYSPEYSLRSWAFLLPFYAILYPLNKFTSLESIWNFYVTRMALGIFSVILEWKLYRQITRSLSISVARMWLFFQIFNPGYFHASVELLPSAFDMLLYLGSIKYTIKYLSTAKNSSFRACLTYNFIAGILGWPFVFILSVPVCVHYLFTHAPIVTVRTTFDCILIFFLVTTVIIGIDSILYGKFALVSWNIFFYNVFNASEKAGPNIFGTEPWYYYFQNFLLNFPLPVLLCSLLGIFCGTLLWPLWMSYVAWFVVFTLQPHKEERFMYPIYGLVTLSAAIGFVKILNLARRLSFALAFFTRVITMLLVVIQAAMRIMSLVHNFTAPLNVYTYLWHLEPPTTGEGHVQVCTGREWYHFPSSFHLPEGYRLAFIRSGFDGLLPGDFLESEGWLEGIRNIPSGMNNLNLFDQEKLRDLDECSFVVDIADMAASPEDVFDPFVELDKGSWRVVHCEKFIDSKNSRILGRSFYVPRRLADIGERLLGNYWNSIYGANFLDYCLFERVRTDSVSEDTEQDEAEVEEQTSTSYVAEI